MVLRIYIASSFDFTEDIKKMEQQLYEEFGNKVEITRDWWNNNIDLDIKHSDEISFSEFLSNQYTRSLCECDFIAIEKSDILLIYNPTKGKKLTGAMIELGYALGQYKTTYMLGWFKKSAMYARSTLVTSFETFMTIIRFYIAGAMGTQVINGGDSV